MFTHKYKQPKNLLSQKKQNLNYFIVFLLLATSGMPVFSHSISYAFLFVFLFVIFIVKRNTFDTSFIILISILIFLFIGQTIVFNFLPLITVIGFFSRVFIAYFVVKILKKDFINTYSNVMCITAIYSLAIHILINIFPFSIDLLKSNFTISVSNYGYLDMLSKYHLGFYTLIPTDILRNSGPFWEPGAFGGYLVIAFIFNIFLKKDNKYILIAIISTFSSTAYIALLSTIYFYYFFKLKSIYMRTFYLILIITFSLIAFSSIDMLGSKISDQLEIASQYNGYGTNNNTQRFINILRDIQDFNGHELIGRGVNPFTRYSFNPEEQIRTVGLTDIIVKFGLPFFILMMFYIYKSFLKLSTFYETDTYFFIGTFISVLILLASEPYFNYPMFWVLLFISFPYNKFKRI